MEAEVRHADRVKILSQPSGEFAVEETVSRKDSKLFAKKHDQEDARYQELKTQHERLRQGLDKVQQDLDEFRRIQMDRRDLEQVCGKSAYCSL
mmetsp:Transcript_56804/g.99007  ORF Transcript_56804/g.99007 Transcript_56804/m.99007 type:complete len:93 (-) Transcript_56804:16-294(-)